MIASPQLKPEPYVSLDQGRRFQNLLNMVFHEERGRTPHEGRCIAVVAADSGAGTTFIARAIASCINNAALQSGIARMARAMTETAHEIAGYVETPEVHPSRLAVIVDHRELSQPGAKAGAVVAEALDEQVLHSRTDEGETVQGVLRRMSVEWDSTSVCRKECLRTLGKTFRLVLVDVPSLRESSEIELVAPIVDGVVVVVEADKSTTKQLARLTNLIELSGGKVLGYVLNKRRYPIPGFLYRYLDKVGLT